MSGVISRSNHPSAYWPGIAKWFGNNYNEFDLEWAQVFERRSSNKALEVEAETTGMGYVPQKKEGEAIQYDSLREGFKVAYRHITYAMGCIVTQEELEDNLYPQLAKKRSFSLARSFRQTGEIVHANQFNRAFNPAYVGGDGASMCSATHNTLAGAKSNVLITPADLAEASIEDLIIQIKCAEDSRGLRINLQPRKLIVPKEETFNATRLTATPLQPDSDLNNINATQTLGMLPDGVMVWNYLEDPDAWFIKTDAPDGLVHWDRVKLGELQQDSDFGTGNALMKNRERYSFGWNDFRQTFGSAGV